MMLVGVVGLEYGAYGSSARLALRPVVSLNKDITVDAIDSE